MSDTVSYGFQEVAQNIGALSFFIETLQLHPDAVKGRFNFDAEQGVFRANLIEKKLAPEHAAAHDEVGASQSAPMRARSCRPIRSRARKIMMPSRNQKIG